jgi:hypothetical protein
MLTRREELEVFKRDIDLVQYAGAAGYDLDRKASSRSSAALRHPNGDKIIIAREPEGHWVYFSVRDDQDHGTIIDFVQRRRGLSLGEVRQELRRWLGNGRSLPLSFPDAGTRLPSLGPRVSRDLQGVRDCFEAMRPIAGHHAYLENARGIPPDVLTHPRFAGCIRTDARGNAVFPHWNRDGICGYELKNHGFTRFAPAGEKGLWLSATTDQDTALVLTESAIDALSHFALRPTATHRYASIAGTLNHSQPELLRQAAARLPVGAAVVLATDNDAGGDKLLATLRGVLAELEPQIPVLEDRPETRGADWNDVLRAARAPAGGR